MVEFHKTYEVVGWAYEADLHCRECASKRFGEELEIKEMIDREGNPVHPLFLDETQQDDACGDCGRLILDLI
ncbi:MAG: hypothetical protein L6435_03495 [Anaerolineae bacterium]|nr:hypothetical protein [Anaerolineae bacterium]